MPNQQLLSLIGDLATELDHAEKIILATLKHMATAQKFAVHAELDAAGVPGEGMTRYHERRAAIDRARRTLDASRNIKAMCARCSLFDEQPIFETNSTGIPTEFCRAAWGYTTLVGDAKFGIGISLAMADGAARFCLTVGDALDLAESIVDYVAGTQHQAGNA